MSMKVNAFLVFAAICLVTASFGQSAEAAKKWFPGHYIIAKGFSEPGNLSLAVRPRQYVLNNPVFRGYKVIYYWSDMEASRGDYDFNGLISILDQAQREGKKVIVQVQDRNWVRNSQFSPIPQYMLSDSTYDGGIYKSNGQQFAKLWVPGVAERMTALLAALGKAIDQHPALAIVNLEETSLPDGSLQAGYTATKYLSSMKAIHQAATDAFPNTIFIQQANWPNKMTKTQATEFMTHLVETLKAGFGGPDIFNDRGALTTYFGKFYPLYSGIAPISMDNQSSGYKENDAQHVFNYAVHEIGAHFVSWAPIELSMNGSTWSIHDAINVVNAQNGRVNPSIPTNVSQTGGGSPGVLVPPTGVVVTTQ